MSFPGQSTADVRIGFLGAGLIATYHSKSLRRAAAPVSRGLVFDTDGERMNAFAAASGHTPATDAASVIANSDAVYICTWTSDHLALIEQAAAAGKAIFCEKPLGLNLAEAQHATHLVGQAGITNQCGLVLRHSPTFLSLKRIIDDPRSGRLLAVQFRDDQFIPTQGHYASVWRSDVAKAGAGTLMEHSIHDIDMIEFLGGPIASVTARTRNTHGLDGIEDLAVASYEFMPHANGSRALGTLTSVWHDVLDRPSLRRVEIFCERAWAAFDVDDWFGPADWVIDGVGSGRWEQADLVGAADTQLAAQGRSSNPDLDFIRAVQRGTQTHPDFATALRAHQVCDAMYQSAAAGGALRSVNQ